MKMIQNLIDIDLKCETEEHMFVNGITGSVDILGKNEYEQFSKWKKEQEGNYMGNDSMLEFLKNRKYIVSDSYDEENEKEKVITKYKKAYNFRMEDCYQVVFILTYGCNFGCSYCYEKNIVSSKKLSREQIDKVFEIYNNNILRIGLFGGEPLLLSNIDNIKYIINKAPDAIYSIITNGYHLVEFFDILKDVKISSIQVTLDGEKDIHDRSRYLKNGAPTYERILQGVKLYAENGITIRVRMNVTSENIDSCMKLQSEIEQQDWAKQYVRFEKQALFQENIEVKIDLKEKLYTENISGGHENEMLRRQGALTNFLFNNDKLQIKIKGCTADYAYRFFDPEGNIYSCILAVGNAKKRVGTYEPELKWDGRSMLKRDITTIPACRQCKYALICGGGCPNAIGEELDLCATPNCAVMKEEIEETIPILYKLRKGKK